MRWHEALLCEQQVSQCCSLLKHRASGTVVLWVETEVIQSGQCGSGRGQHDCVTARSDDTECGLECDSLSTSAVRVTRPSWPQWSGCGTKPQSKGTSSASRGIGSRTGVGQYCCEIVTMSKANLHPMAMCSTSTSDRPPSKVGVMSTSANKRRKLLSVLLSSSSDESNHSRATQHGCGGLETENAVRSRQDGTCMW